MQTQFQVVSSWSDQTLISNKFAFIVWDQVDGLIFQPCFIRASWTTDPLFYNYITD